MVKNKSKVPPKVYLVEDCGNAPGRILACFAHEEDALLFIKYIDRVEIRERTLWYGQPIRDGYNE